MSKSSAGGKSISPYRIVGYVGAGSDIASIDASKLTHINYAFALINPDGSLYFEYEDAPAQLEQLNRLKASRPELKILVSIGGWGADHFSDIALTDSSRGRFAEQVGQMIEMYALDGVDVDWEYPGQPGPGISHRPEDKENFTLLLEAVRNHLDMLSDAENAAEEGRYLLTIASKDDDVYFAHTEMERLHLFLDFINVMSYDFYTLGSQTTGHHSSLFSSEESPHPFRTSQAGIERHLNAGIPAEKIVLGVAFYGRGWSGVESTGKGRYQPYEAFYGEYGYGDLVDRFIDKNGFKRYWDESAKAPYLWNPDSAIFISYEDPMSLQHKASFVRENKLGGIMFWEHRHDSSGLLLRTIYSELTKKGPAE